MPSVDASLRDLSTLRLFFLVISIFSVAVLSGCATLDNNGAAVKHAAVRAAIDVRTWAPVLGAAVFAATDGDRRVSDWAVEQRPLFGSREAALNAGDDLRDITTAGAVVTAFAVIANPPSPPFSKGGMEDPDASHPPLNADTAHPPLKKGGWGGFLVQTGAHFAAAGTTWAIKHSVERERPDGSDAQGFPSGHATAAFADAAIAQRNIDGLDLSPLARSSLNAGFDALAVGTAWARIESGAHYPSDVLAGAAIGHFMAAVVNDAFLDDDHEIRFGFLPSRHGSRLEFSLAF